MGIYFLEYPMIGSFFYSLAFVTALEALVEKRITGFPVIDDDWILVILFTILTMARKKGATFIYTA